MTFKTVCDNCGKEVESPVNTLGQPYNPPGWYCRTLKRPEEPTRERHACCQDCLDALVKKDGGLVLPW